MKTIAKLVFPLLAIGMFSFGIYHLLKANQELPKPPPPISPTRSPYGATIAGSGIVEAETENISIGSALSGVVTEVYVPVSKVGQRVEAGEPLFRVDDRQLKAQLIVQQAMVEAAQSELAKLQARPRSEELPPLEAKVRAAQANSNLMLDQYQRAEKLFKSNSIGAEEYTSRRLNYDASLDQLAQAKAELQLLQAGTWAPDIAIAKAAVAQAAAEVQQTQTEIDRALVRAPVAGDVLQVNVRPGEFVSAPSGKALIVLGDIHRLHVRVDIDEQDIPRFARDGEAVAYVRGETKEPLALKYVRVEPFVIPKRSLTGDNTERVDTRVLQVIYALDATAKPIFVGQQMDVYIQAAGNVPREIAPLQASNP